MLAAMDDSFLAEEAAGFVPLAVPHDAKGARDWLRLIRSRRVGPATFRRLMFQYGTAAEALLALPGIAATSGVSNYEPCPPGVAEAELRAASAAGARMLCLGGPDYPAALAAVPDAPPVLWALGRVELLERRCLALVGARNASALGQRMARKLSAELGGLGYVTVSGLARGIDSAVHAATLASGTIAVQAGGVDILYPPENAGLASEIAAQGLRLSEAPMGLEPQARDFPRRNRIISGLSLALVVIEGATRSGSLITAKCALDQGRDVMAVPGHPFDARAGGCNQLIRDGAVLVRSAEDVHAALGGLRPARPDVVAEVAATVDATDADTRLMALVGPSPVHEDLLTRQSGLPAPLVAQVLMRLEIEGKVNRLQGGLIALA